MSITSSIIVIYLVSIFVFGSYILSSKPDRDFFTSNISNFSQFVVACVLWPAIVLIYLFSRGK